jgi:Protein of unknown function (DUF1488)
VALTFPNASRSYDAAGKRVRFVGYDGMFEVAFFVEAAAIANASLSEIGYLQAFDAARDSIQDVAREAYANSRKNMYVLKPADFR